MAPGADDTPAVSVVMPTHNRTDLLRSSLGSVLRQQRVELEVVVVDDGSCDSTPAMLAAVSDPRMRTVRHETPRGVVHARNSGIAAARGRWVAFCDDDDLWAPDKLARQLEAARAAARSWVYVGSVDVDLDQQVLGGAPPAPPETVVRQLREFNAVPGGGSGTLVSAEMLGRVGGFDATWQDCHIEDWELWLRCNADGPPAWVPAPLVGYRVHTGNASLDVEGLLEGVARLEARHDLLVDRSVFYRHAAWSALRAGQRREALRCLLRAAAHGQIAPLARELAGTARGRLGLKRQRPHRHAAWHAEAQSWLDELPR